MDLREKKKKLRELGKEITRLDRESAKLVKEFSKLQDDIWAEQRAIRDAKYAAMTPEQRLAKIDKAFKLFDQWKAEHKEETDGGDV